MNRMILTLRAPALVAGWVIVLQIVWHVERFRNPWLLFGAVMVLWLTIEQIAKRRHP